MIHSHLNFSKYLKPIMSKTNPEISLLKLVHFQSPDPHISHQHSSSCASQTSSSHPFHSSLCRFPLTIWYYRLKFIYFFGFYASLIATILVQSCHIIFYLVYCKKPPNWYSTSHSFCIKHRQYSLQAQSTLSLRLAVEVCRVSDSYHKTHIYTADVITFQVFKTGRTWQLWACRY